MKRCDMCETKTSHASGRCGYCREATSGSKLAHEMMRAVENAN